MLMRPFMYLPSCYILLKVLVNIHFSSWRYSYLVGYFVFPILGTFFFKFPHLMPLQAHPGYMQTDLPTK